MRLALFILFAFFMNTLSAQSLSVKQNLTSPFMQWYFNEEGKTEFMSCVVPGNVHRDLVLNKQIPDPLIGTNETDVQWVGEKSWEYTLNDFVCEPNILLQDKIELRLNGIDTYAKIFLNDIFLGETNNAFVQFDFDVKGILLPKGNKLRIVFSPAEAYAKQKLSERTLPLPGDSIRAVCRKPQYHFGWDWGPKLVTCGITKNIEVVGHTDMLFETFGVETLSLNEGKAQMRAHIHYRADKEEKVTVAFNFGGQLFKEEFISRKGEHDFIFPFELNEPKLWWPNEAGTPFMYLVQCTLQTASGKANTRVMKAGVRTIELVNKPDEFGESFFFKVNGKSIFMKGANYIPLRMLPGVYSESEYRTLLEKCRGAHFNMLRVWGGGIYESDLFYSLCDEMGILIWQDFMFACSMYPGDAKFLESVQKEAEQNVRRISYHPCTALWCGNNENAEAWSNWGWKSGLSASSVSAIDVEYNQLFNQLLPGIVGHYSNLPYWPSSPQFGRGNKESLDVGDSHYWGLWHDEQPFSVLETKVPRFMSEFGMQSFPSEDVLKLMSPLAPFDLNSDGIKLHQKNARGFGLMKQYTEQWYPEASKLPTQEYAKLTQEMQAEGMCRAIEVQRSNPRCGGTLYWQLNDVWPSFSWSSIDVLGKEKIFHQKLKESYAPQLLTYKVENDSLYVVWVDDQYSNSYYVNISGEIKQLQKKNARGIGFSGISISVNGKISTSEGISLRELKGKYERMLLLNAQYKDVLLERSFTIR
jgi:beta-mannosidase